MQYYPREGQPRWGNVREELLLDAALSVANVPGEVLSETVRPPLQQVEAFPPRMGYRTYADRQIRVEDVIDVPRIYSDRRVSWTGTQGSYSGTSRPSMEQA